MWWVYLFLVHLVPDMAAPGDQELGLTLFRPHTEQLELLMG